MLSHQAPHAWGKKSYSHCLDHCLVRAAPEMRFPRKAAYDGRSSDLWSLGVVLRALLLGR